LSVLFYIHITPIFLVILFVYFLISHMLSLWKFQHLKLYSVGDFWTMLNIYPNRKKTIFYKCLEKTMLKGGVGLDLFEPYLLVFII